MASRRECRLAPLVVAFMYLALLAGAYLAPVPPGVSAVITPDGLEVVYWDGVALVAVEGSSTTVYWRGEWLRFEGAVAEAACTWNGYLAVAAARGPYTLLAQLQADGSWRAVEAPGAPVALACAPQGPLAAASLGPRLAVLSLEGEWLVPAAGGLLERRLAVAYLSVGAPVLVLGGGAILWGPEPLLLEAPEGWSLAGAAETPWGLAPHGSAGGDGVVAWLSGLAMLVDAGSEESVEALSGGSRPVGVVRVEGQVPVLLEVSSPGSAATHRYYPYAPMIYRGAYAGEQVAGFTETLVGLGPAAVAADSLGYAPLGEAGVVARASGVTVESAAWTPRLEPLEAEPLGPPRGAPPPSQGEPLQLRVEEAGVDRLSPTAAAAVLGSAAAAYVLRATMPCREL